LSKAKSRFFGKEKEKADPASEYSDGVSAPASALQMASVQRSMKGNFKSFRLFHYLDAAFHIHFNRMLEARVLMRLNDRNKLIATSALL
jgi:hypothetical protein